MSRDSATGNRQNREQGMAQQEAVRSPAGQAKKQRSGILAILGPGLITGASDDDPSGIATYSQAGAQFGYATAWVMLFTWPLMCAIQEISARIGRVTGKGIAANLRDHYSKPLLYGIVALGARRQFHQRRRSGAMGALRLLVGGRWDSTSSCSRRPAQCWKFFELSTPCQDSQMVTLALFAYTGDSVCRPHAVGRSRLQHVCAAHILSRTIYLTAILGRRSAPICFWQASEEADDERIDPQAHPLNEAPGERAGRSAGLRSTHPGMALSNIIALFIIITTGDSNAHNITTSRPGAGGAGARPIAEFAFAIFALNFWVPVCWPCRSRRLGRLALLGRDIELEHRSRPPPRTPRFYATIVAGTLVDHQFYQP